METILIWAAVSLPALLWGGSLAYFFTRPIFGFLAALLPFLLLTAAILYTEFCTAYEGGGASMWLIAVVVGGSVTAFFGWLGWLLSGRFFKNRP